MNAIAKLEQTALTAMSEEDLLDVLQSSLYPGAALPSIKMVLGYCKAGGLDPMQKPVHIVPMNVKKPGTRDQYEWRDTVMPGIGLYRTQAARTGEHVGTDKPVFGPMVEFKVGDFTMQVPEWCEVTVYRMKSGIRCAYTACEYWVENYATAGRDSSMPNAMWKKRSRGQLAKCAEAQALRKGFPEVGNQPTAEEMEGKFIDAEDLPAAPESRKPAVAMPQSRSPSPAPTPATDVSDAVVKAPAAGPAPSNTEPATVGERQYILNRCRSNDIEVAALMLGAGIEGLPADLAGLTKEGFSKLKAALPK